MTGQERELLQEIVWAIHALKTHLEATDDGGTAWRTTAAAIGLIALALAAARRR